MQTEGWALLVKQGRSWSYQVELLPLVESLTDSSGLVVCLRLQLTLNVWTHESHRDWGWNFSSGASHTYMSWKQSEEHSTLWSTYSSQLQDWRKSWWIEEQSLRKSDQESPCSVAFPMMDSVLYPPVPVQPNRFAAQEADYHHDLLQSNG